jgi:tyrosyl-tRNA synthetase
MDVDVELCGTDQIFNALAGRTLLKRIKNKDKFVVALNLMENPKTGELMSKSKGTGVFLSLPSNEMYGAIMAQPDEMIEIFLINNTRVSLKDKDEIMALGPRLAKARAAFEIVKIFYGEKEARLAEDEFNKTFSAGGIPYDVKELRLGEGVSLAQVLMEGGFISSKTDWRRLIQEGAVRDSRDTKITDKDYRPKETTVLKIGKRRFVKIII